MRKLLIIILFFMGLSAAYGGVDLAFFNAKLMKLPPELIANSFGSYLIPGLILLIVIGGTNLIAGIAVVKRTARAVEWSAIAGFGVMIWFFAELYIFPGHHFIQIVYFVLGIATLILTLAAERYGFAGGTRS